MSETIRPAWQEKQLRGVYRLSKLNGRSVEIFGILGGILGILFFSIEGILMGVLIAGAGWVELEGRKKLVDGIADAPRWLMGGEALLLFVIVVYAFAHLMALDPLHAIDILGPEIRTMLSELGGLSEQMLNELIYSAARWLYLGLIIGTVAYQGGMIGYYHLKTRDI